MASKYISSDTSKFFNIRAKSVRTKMRDTKLPTWKDKCRLGHELGNKLNFRNPHNNLTLDKRLDKIFKAVLFGLFLLSPRLHAYTTVVASTAAPKNLETQFVSMATNYFQAGLIVNPFVQGVYQLTLYGVNPNYVPPKVVTIDTTTWFSNIAAMQALLPAISSDSYSNGWANGEVQERFRDIGYMTSFYDLCNDTSTFQIQGTTNTLVNISSTTCQSVLGTVSDFIYQQTFSTFPAILNGY